MIDTHALVWTATAPSRLSEAARRALSDGAETLLVSAVTAYEYADLNRRGRFGVDLPLQAILDQFDARVVDFPAACWSIAAALPQLHFDPVDRMLVAHAIHDDHTLITADATIRRYPVRTLW